MLSIFFFNFISLSLKDAFKVLYTNGYEKEKKKTKNLPENM